MMHVPDILFFSAPLIAVLLISVIFECIRPERPDTRPGRLPVMILLLIPLTAVGSLLYFLIEKYLIVLLYETHYKRMIRYLSPAALALTAFLVQLTGRCIAKKLSLTRRNRIISLILMLIILTAGVPAVLSLLA